MKRHTCTYVYPQAMAQIQLKDAIKAAINDYKVKQGAEPLVQAH